MKKYLLILLTLIHLSNGYSQQSEDTIYVFKFDEFYVNRAQQRQYQAELGRIKRVYPLAIKAKAILDEYELTLSSIEKKKDAKRYSRKMKEYLNEEFSYAIRDLYVSEGRLLIQLIHRETGMTVKEIMQKYTNGFQSLFYTTAAKVMNHDLNDKYDATSKNRMTEMVIQDILAGSTEINMKMDKMTKEKFKETQQEYRNSKKTSRIEYRELKKEIRNNEKANKKINTK